MLRSVADIELKLLIEAIFLRYSYDFRNYSLASLRRRVALAQRHLECEHIAALQHRILHEPKAFMELLQFLTIPVSEMFRDPAYYRAVREQVIPLLRTYPSLKIWVAGCSTGEEVYSLAILLKEEGLLERSIIYATDINPRSLERAQQGIFDLKNVRHYTRNYQLAGGRHSFSDYYTAAYDSVLLDRALKERVTFADHSLATDSVFSETQFISCRNVLIYFNRALQDRALGLFHESLCHRGFLGLGSKETVEFSAFAQAFEGFARDERIFRKL